MLRRERKNAHILTDFCNDNSFCEADNLLNDGVATPLFKSVRVVNSSHLINHCIALNSASNFARRYKIKPITRRRTIMDERLIIIQPHIGMRVFFGHLILLKPQRGVSGMDVEFLSIK
jgi:hypothetical protein